MNPKTEITEVQIFPVKPNNGLVAFASCLLDEKMYLASIAIYTKLDGSGFRILFPTKKLTNGVQVNYFHPVNKECCLAISEAILKKANELFNTKSHVENSL